MIRIMPFTYYLDKEEELRQLNERNIFICPKQYVEPEVNIIDIEHIPLYEDINLSDLLDLEIK